MLISYVGTILDLSSYPSTVVHLWMTGQLLGLRIEME